MERKKCSVRRACRLLVVMMMVWPALTYVSFASTTPREVIYKAYVTGHMEEWKGIIDRMEEAGKEDHSRLLELVNYQYGYIGYAIGNGDKVAASRLLTLAEKNVEILEKARYRPSMTHAYRAAFYGFRIGLNPSSAPFNGLKSLRAANQAVNSDAANWFALLQKANIQFYMPPAFGGSKKEALSYLIKARQLMEKESRLTQGNWNYLSLLTLIVQTCEALDDLPEAKRTCELILSKEPGFTWVRDGICPAITKKMTH